jgi:pimeloyl-ACP methyl ester carboxylesterase
MGRWRGLKALVHDAVDATTEVVREGQDAARRNVLRAAGHLEPVAGPVRAVTGAVGLSQAVTLGSVRAVNRVVETLTDLALEAAPLPPEPDPEPIPLRSDVLGTPAWIADAALGALNGAVGDHLAARGNPLDLGLVLRHGDRYLDPAAPADVAGTVVVLVHGLGTTEWCWALDAEAYHGDPAATFGSLLARDAAVAPLFARYNTGRRVAENGRSLALALDRALAGRDVRRVVLLGHSMGGLVARAACRTAAESGLPWRDRLDLVVSLGTPHQGAGLARLGETAAAGLGAVDASTTRVLARLLAGRSAGVRDLEHGDLTGLGRDPDAVAAPADRAVPLLDGVRYAFLSATVTTDADHPVGAWLGDLLVRVGSASGPVEQGSFPIHNETFGGILHHQLQCHPAVYAQVRRLIAGGDLDGPRVPDPTPAG